MKIMTNCLIILLVSELIVLERYFHIFCIRLPYKYNADLSAPAWFELKISWKFLIAFLSYIFGNVFNQVKTFRSNTQQWLQRFGNDSSSGDYARESNDLYKIFFEKICFFLAESVDVQPVTSSCLKKWEFALLALFELLQEQACCKQTVWGTTNGPSRPGLISLIPFFV